MSKLSPQEKASLVQQVRQMKLNSQYETRPESTLLKEHKALKELESVKRQRDSLIDMRQGDKDLIESLRKEVFLRNIILTAAVILLLVITFL